MTPLPWRAACPVRTGSPSARRSTQRPSTQGSSPAEVVRVLGRVRRHRPRDDVQLPRQGIPSDPSTRHAHEPGLLDPAAAHGRRMCPRARVSMTLMPPRRLCDSEHRNPAWAAAGDECDAYRTSRVVAWANTAGDRAAFADLYEQNARAVCNHALRLTGSWSEAEDVTSETFLAAWRAGDRGTGGRLPHSVAARHSHIQGTQRQPRTVAKAGFPGAQPGASPRPGLRGRDGRPDRRHQPPGRRPRHTAPTAPPGQGSDRPVRGGRAGLPAGRRGPEHPGRHRALTAFARPEPTGQAPWAARSGSGRCTRPKSGPSRAPAPPPGRAGCARRARTP